jgi:hypothetical protein
MGSVRIIYSLAAAATIAIATTASKPEIAELRTENSIIIRDVHMACENFCQSGSTYLSAYAALGAARRPILLFAIGVLMAFSASDPHSYPALNSSA